MYYTGQGVQKDLKKARDLFEKYAKQGNQASKNMLKILQQYPLHEHIL